MNVRNFEIYDLCDINKIVWDNQRTDVYLIGRSNALYPVHLIYAFHEEEYSFGTHPWARAVDMMIQKLFSVKIAKMIDALLLSQMFN